MSVEELVKKKFEEAKSRLKAKNEDFIEELKRRLETIRNEVYKKFQGIGV